MPFNIDQAKTLLDMVATGENFKVVAKEILKEAKTDIDQKAVTPLLESTQKRILLQDPAFRREVESNKLIVRAEIGKVKREMEAKRRAKQMEVKSAEFAHTVFGKAAVGKVSLQTQGELEAKIVESYVCPICHGPNRNIVVNGELICWECKHPLVPESELGNYNRKYRRNWSRKHKKSMISKGK